MRVSFVSSIFNWTLKACPCARVLPAFHMLPRERLNGGIGVVLDTFAQNGRSVRRTVQQYVYKTALHISWSSSIPLFCAPSCPIVSPVGVSRGSSCGPAEALEKKKIWERPGLWTTGNYNGETRSSGAQKSGMEVVDKYLVMNLFTHFIKV